MESNFLQLLVFGFFAALANIFGGLALFPSKLHRNYKGALKYLLALGAGFMLAVTFVEILPKTIILWQKSNPAAGENLYLPMLLLLAGYLLTQFFEHTIAPHFHLGDDHEHANEESHEPLISSSSAYSGLTGLLIHTFFDGVAISAAAQIDVKAGFLVFVAVFLHKFPEGFTVGSMILSAGKGIREVVIATTLLGITTLAGVILFYTVGNNLGFSVAYALPLASGVTLYVAATDLIPEVNHHGGNRILASIAVFLGVALFFAIHFGVHHFFE